MIFLLPDLVNVMEPVKCPEPFDNNQFVYQVKWDGTRILASVNDNKVCLVNKHMRDRTFQYNELQRLPEHINARSAVLDGEVVVLKDSKPHFPSVMRRDRCSKPQSLGYLNNLLPINYMVFDLLFLNGRDLRNKTLEYRKNQLHKIILEQPYLNLVEDFESGQTLFNAVKDMGLEGIVAKRLDSRYCPGKKHKEWLKIKCNRIQLCIVGGYTLRGQQLNSLLLGGISDEKLIYIGKASSGLTAAQYDILLNLLPELQIPDSPFANLSSQQKDFHFIKPQLGVRIEYLEWTDDIKLRFPVIKDFVDINCQGFSI